ncbi:CBS domain-containing protein [Kribbella sp. NPDC050124]|uniref:CBS domain-containing protein n=1 Tax=Kribbella sp. NPDC050124 TaxID=3364114 RepID=UPI0037A701D1
MKHLLTVGDVMTTEVVMVAEDTSYKAVVATLAHHRISAVPVRSAFGGVAGIVSETDLMHKEEFQRRRLYPWLRSRGRSKAEALTAAQLMTRPAVTVDSSCTLDRAARLMADRDITRLIVVDGDEPVGIVTRSDLLSAFLSPDHEVLARVRRAVVDRGLWDDPFAVEVTVLEGVVTLAGQVENRSMVALAERYARDVDGVVSVSNNLTWAFDDTAAAPGTTGLHH